MPFSHYLLTLSWTFENIFCLWLPPPWFFINPLHLRHNLYHFIRWPLANLWHRHRYLIPLHICHCFWKHYQSIHRRILSPSHCSDLNGEENLIRAHLTESFQIGMLLIFGSFDFGLPAKDLPCWVENFYWPILKSSFLMIRKVGKNCLVNAPKVGSESFLKNPLV